MICVALVIGNAAYPDEGRALLDLQRIEEDRKDLAARLLETVWRVHLPGSRDATGHGNELGSRLAA